MVQALRSPLLPAKTRRALAQSVVALSHHAAGHQATRLPSARKVNWAVCPHRLGTKGLLSLSSPFYSPCSLPEDVNNNVEFYT